MHLRAKQLTALGVAIATLSGCQSVTNGYESVSKTVQEVGAKHGTLILCGVGAVGGAVLGAKLSDKEHAAQGALLGGALGTVGGCFAGSVWQSKMQALEQIAKEENLKIQVEPLELAVLTGNSTSKDGGLVALVQDEGMFPSNASQLTANGKRQAQKLAQTFAQRAGEGSDESQRRFLVVGHTDSTGDTSTNQKLSEQRAREVGKVLQGAGISASRIYYQGAGSSRPVANNETVDGRNSNRRVEISEMNNEDVLVKRVQAESSNAKYAVYSAGSLKKPATLIKTPGKTPSKTPRKTQEPVVASAPTQTPASTTSTTTPVQAKEVPASKALVDFGGVPASNEQSVTAAIKPKTGGFTLVSSAQANELPFQSCEADAPRETGRVLSLDSDKPLIEHQTRDYIPGYNNRVWANIVNGNLLTITPVSILKENAAVGQQPFLEVIKNYDGGNRDSLKKIPGVANTYEGESQVLYRVFTKDPKAPVSCIDVVFEKNAPLASKGQVFYPRGQSAYVAEFVPKKNS
jgi:outer membrane protein OmpA-like peptidoglycan-associated protein